MTTTVPVAVTTDVLHDLRDEARAAGRAALEVRQMVLDQHGNVTIRHGDWTVNLRHGRDRATASLACEGEWSVRFVEIDGEEGIIVGYTTSDLGRI